MGLNGSLFWISSWCMLDSLELAKTVKQKQSSQQRGAEGSQVAVLAAWLGEVFIDYAELSAQHQSKS